MKKVQLLLLIITIVAGLILAGCSENQQTSTTDPYVGGTKGLTIKFLDGQPPEMIFDGNTMPFSVGLMLENKGEHSIFEDITNDFDFGRLMLRGINPSHYNITQADLVLDFKNETISIPGYKKNPADGTELQGGMTTTQFPIMNYQYDLQGNNEVTFGVDMCYNYKTKSTTNICIVSDVTKKNTICEPQGMKTPMNSGAPVQVTKLIQAFAGNGKLSLMIEISKVDASGQIYKLIDTNNTPNKLCDPTPSNINQQNKVFVTVYTPNAEETNLIQCSEFQNTNEGSITLYNGQPKMFVCNMDVEDINQDYTLPLYIDLEYAYGDYIEKTIELKDYD